MKETRTTNPEFVELMRFLKKQSTESKTSIWRDIAERLAKPSRHRVAVNLGRLNRYTRKNETVVVPGKVLGTGTISHPLTVAALSFSERAKQKITAARGKHISFSDLAKRNPKGSNVRIIG